MKLLREQLKVLCNTFHVEVHDVFLLLQYIMGQSYNFLFFEKEFEMNGNQMKKFKKYMQLRSNGMPVAKITERKFFYNREFRTTLDTLDPRPETEIIIDLFLKYFPDQSAPLTILDLGCGTGCIGLSILDLYHNSTACFADISDKALTVANINAKNLSLADCCTFVKSNWFENIQDKFDVIVCNPPYIESDYKLNKDTLYDPYIALFGGQDGVDAYRQILPNMYKFLHLNGKLFLEFGVGQSNEICSMAKQWNLKLIEIAKDLQGIERTAVFTNLVSH